MRAGRRTIDEHNLEVVEARDGEQLVQTSGEGDVCQSEPPFKECYNFAEELRVQSVL
jgi:hypothetical protein